jgi:hypothetical protein
MATKRYSINPQDYDRQVTEATGLAVVTKSIELTVDWDGLIASGLSGQQARLQVLASLEKLHSYIETVGKFNANA